MERWSDRPAPEQDPIDRFAAISSVFFKRYSAQIAKFAPPAAGFALFLLYFHTNHFYPSFDLLQFSSLLLGAGMVGFLIIGLLMVGLLVPGLVIFHGFIERPEIRAAILRWFGPHEVRELRKAFGLLSLMYAGPYSLTSIILSSILLHFPAHYIEALILAPIAVCLLFGIAIQLTLKLPRSTFLRFAYCAWVPVMMVGIVAFSVIANTAQFIDGIENGDLKTLAVYLIPLGACLAAAMCAAGSFGGFTYAVHFALFFALAIAFYSGVLAGMPDRVVRNLGLGNYEAQSVVLEKGYCDGAPPKDLPLTSECELRNVQVVWSMGDVFTFRVGNAKDPHQIQLPSRFVKAIVRSTN
ncbi:hypothetical protein [Pseudomonas multiresinivorans]|uniref:Uncharacterized protein n=1 Tax=Pseudomonas multiresinivorans TaxID=95301 RepID=A0A7Z3GS42_9PSED|nr:hypothetical protein [Pseudomonas multiresinivorans]QJP10713.1 hypothetical protein G4G71_23570 [Pseudomonas multiresinivorans]